VTNTDQECMREVLLLAQQAEAEGEVPVGAVVVANDEIIGRGYNQVIANVDPTAHAEIQALRAAAHTLSNYRLPGATLYVSLEPCAMCAGAMVHARISRLVYGCTDPRAGAAGSVFNIVQARELNHQIEVVGGVLETECRELLQAFFRARR
jgi:tRNA(adenine34) deaminase